MARWKQIPVDLRAMSLDQLRALHESYDGPEKKAEYDALLAARDAAQTALLEFGDRSRAVTFALIEKEFISVGIVLDDPGDSASNLGELYL